MKIVIAGNEPFKDTQPILDTPHSVVYVNSSIELRDHDDADVFVDFCFNGLFYSPKDKPVLIAETIKTFPELEGCPVHTARFCDWNGFAERKLWEIVAAGNMEWLTEVLKTFDKGFVVVEDMPGLVAPRIVSMIINEACYTLADKISTVDEIDIAMKLGTNYPDGPFAWAKRIGTSRVCELLEHLSKTNDLYTPHPLLKMIDQWL